MGLPPLRFAAPAGDGLEDLNLFASFAILNEVADEDQAVVAAVWPETLKARVVSVAGVVTVEGVYSGGVHNDLQVCGPGLGEWLLLRGLFCIRHPYYTVFVCTLSNKVRQ